MVSAPYTVQALGAGESIAHVELTPAEVAGVVKVFNAVNMAEAKSGLYEPLLWLWRGHLTEVPANDCPSYDPTFVWPVNHQWYWWRMRASKQPIPGQVT